MEFEYLKQNKFQHKSMQNLPSDGTEKWPLVLSSVSSFVSSVIFYAHLISLSLMKEFFRNLLEIQVDQ